MGIDSPVPILGVSLYSKYPFTRSIPVLLLSKNMYSEYYCTFKYGDPQTILEIVLEKLNKREGLQRVVYCRSAFVEKEYGERRRKN